MQIGNQEYPYSATSLEGGKVLVGNTAIALTFTLIPKTILVTADKLNTGTIYLGNSDVSFNGNNAFTYLSAGDTISMDYNDSVANIYVVATDASQYFWKGGFK